MLTRYKNHNLFKDDPTLFLNSDPQLLALSKLKYQHASDWWRELPLTTPGIYILTGGRQVGKSTSCKLLIEHCLKNNFFTPTHILYLPCDEIYDAKALSDTIRFFLHPLNDQPFLLIIDEITFVKDWDRVIKALADEGCFRNGICLLTGSDTLILKEAAMAFPGRRGQADQVDFHLYPLSFSDYVTLRLPTETQNLEKLKQLFDEYLVCGGYLRAINDLAETGTLSKATHLTYEQWIRGDFLKNGKKENTLLAILQALLTIGVSPISYSGLTQKVGLISKETCIDYCHLLERMDLLVTLQAFDQNKKQGFPRKDRKFHFSDPFILQTLYQWLKRENYWNTDLIESMMVEACVASHCHRFGKTFYFKGQGEIDVIWLSEKNTHAIEVKWSEQIRPSDLKTLKLFNNALILTKAATNGAMDTIQSIPVYQFLAQLK